MSDLSILDSLAVPKTFDDLVMQIQARDCNMFHPMMGLPYAYMEVPILIGHPLRNPNPAVEYERWVYKVLSWHMPGPRSACEEPLVAHYWKMFVQMRKDFAKLHGDVDPLIVWRRYPEFEEIPASQDFIENRVRSLACRIYMRFAIPGLELRLRPEFWDERRDRDDTQWRLLPEAVV